MDKEIKEHWGKQFSANKGGTDEWYTPREAVEVIAKYIPNGSRILCPFDKAESEYVKVLSRNNNVIYSHIEDGVDFFKLEKPDVDYIISNPPYSLRNEILKKLFSWGIPFALLLNTNGLFDSATRFRIAKKIEGGVQICFLYPRVQYKNDETNEFSSPPFESCYLGYRIFDRDLSFEYITDHIDNERQISIFELMGE